MSNLLQDQIEISLSLGGAGTAVGAIVVIGVITYVVAACALIRFLGK